MFNYKEMTDMLEMHLGITTEMAIESGIFDSFDRLDEQAGVERRHAARILHTIMKQRGILDLDNIEPASKLLDLYDCRVCVNHIAQVYLRGVMTERLEGIFDGRAVITRQEAESAIERVRFLYTLSSQKK